ncbi:hypothetical protein JNJ66_05130 [Candidatus Saccharibacteria bacterium]|nr:hypothetical protein [Candidatus Saccharibacteria bacterium]
MNDQPTDNFVYESYDFNPAAATATFRYSFNGTFHFTEEVSFTAIKSNYDAQVLDAALKLYFYLAGVSYFKLYPTPNVVFTTAPPDGNAATLLNNVYTHGLSQFLYENDVPLSRLPVFAAQAPTTAPHPYAGQGTVALQSGGKDSLLTATLLERQGIAYTPWYMTYGATHPGVLDTLHYVLRTVSRKLDLDALREAQSEGGLNGHVPITFMVMALAVIDAILHGENTILVSNGAEGAEPHGHIGDIPVNHQWSKTWEAELLFSSYITHAVSPDIRVGSPLRALSELRIVELFSQLAWPRFGHDFSSCNQANYRQGGDNRRLLWDGTCPKCANAFLLFAPFIEPSELAGVIGGNLFANPALHDTFRGLLGIDGVMKPFECVGETEELRLAYHMARQRWGEAAYALPFEVPASNFDYRAKQPQQTWTRQYAPQA